ncbi:hypothetical protein A9Q84_15355 [Halobacteriovorax marinus]|uniref:Uncharacterized protein n=1 Tax=Halobacteriovorax marinus TaxID=97084 RepID=A0A1Y5FB66_9BACT|nr:hypothetical protein A9Q84_15355 [Halobacteriovorax marinus]
MKKLLIGLTLLASTSSFAIDWSTAEADMKKAADEAHFATELKFCDSEEALRELVETMDIQNSLGCKNAIQDARKTLEPSEILSILTTHVDDLKHIQSFEKIVKTDIGYVELVASVKRLKERGISLNFVKRNTNLTDGEMLKIELSFERSKSDIERALENL